MTSKLSKFPFFRFLQSKIGIFCLVFFAFNAFTLYGIFFFFHITSMESFVIKYPLLDPMRFFMKEEDIITTLQPIRLKFQDIVQKNDPEGISLYFEYFNTGANISINPDLRILPASLIKVPLAMAVMKKVERGEWLLTNELVIMKDDRDINWGEVYKRPIGSTLTIQELVEEMLLNSDNTAYRVLYRNMSFDDMQDVLTNLGLEDLFSEEGKMSSKEYTRLIRSLYSSTYLNVAHSQHILGILSRTSYDAYLGQ